MRNHLIPILCLLSITAGAQLSTSNGDSSGGSQPRIIEVWGTAETWTAPTSVNFRVKLSTRHFSKTQGLAENEAKLKILKSLAKEFDIADRDILVDNVRSFEDYHNHPKQPYGVERTVNLTLNSPNRMDALIRAIINRGGGDVSSTSLLLGDPIAVRNEARKQALLAAKTKAHEMAGTLGEATGRAYKITEVQASSWNSVAANTVSTATQSQSSERNGLVSTKASVKVTFLLKN